MSKVHEVSYSGAIIDDVAEIAGVQPADVAAVFVPGGSRAVNNGDGDVLAFRIAGRDYAALPLTGFMPDRDSDGSVLEFLARVKFVDGLRPEWLAAA